MVSNNELAAYISTALAVIGMIGLLITFYFQVIDCRAQTERHKKLRHNLIMASGVCIACAGVILMQTF